MNNIKSKKAREQAIKAFAALDKEIKKVSAMNEKEYIEYQKETDLIFNGLLRKEIQDLKPNPPNMENDNLSEDEKKFFFKEN